MTGNSRRIAGALATASALAALAGCASVPGTGGANPTDVAAYQSTIASSRAAAAAEAGKSACASWKAGYDARIVATRATVAFTKNPGWNWDTITGTLNAEQASIATESGKLPAVLTTAQPNPSVHTLLTDYKTKLDAYGQALRTDQAARGIEDQTWTKSNPARSELIASTNTLSSACPN
jgi:hypothetical protein